MTGKITLEKIDKFAREQDGQCVVYKTSDGKVGVCSSDSPRPKNTRDWDYYFIDEPKNFPKERFLE